MTKTTTLSRRKLLGRVGLLAVAGYSVPALTTLSMAHAGSGASGGSSSGGSSSGSSNSGASNSGSSNSGASNSGPSGAGTGAPATPAETGAICGPEDLNSPTYLQCLVDNGL